MKNKIRFEYKKHLLRRLVSVGFLLLIFCLNSREVCAETPTVEFTYKTIKNVNNEDEVEITGCTITGSGSEGADIVIPKTINVNGTYLPVTSIGQQAFDSENIKSVDTSDVLYVGNLAFSGCENLISVNMPKVTQIGEGAFDDCIKIESVEMPEVKNIGINAFRSCNNLESVSMPNAKSIGGEAFYQCTSLESITMDNVTSIGYYAFIGCTNLESIILPKATSIAQNAFNQCGNLKNVYVSANAGDGVLSSIPSGATKIYLASPISLDKENLAMEPGESTKLNVTVPQNANDPSVSWESSNNNVVSVDDSGNLTAIGGGTATITVTANDVGKAKATCVVTVNQMNPEPIVNETSAMNKRLLDSLIYAANLSGNQVVYFEEYDGKDCITGDVLDFLSEHPNVTLVLDYTFFDEDTKKDIHCHVVINQAILSKVMRDDIKYYGAAILSGFVQYYDDLPAEIKNKNL